MIDNSIELSDLGKCYKLFTRQADRVLCAFGMDRFLPWHKTPYQEFWALRHLDLRIRKGERIGIIGPNGAGKSTLLKIISGNIRPTEGRVHVQGRIQALLELGTGFHPEFTGRENIRASLALNGLSSVAIVDREDEIIDFAELDEFIDQPLKTYSAGMGARLAFSTATAIEPEILIIDEVLGAGDAYFAGKCLERMRRLTHESGATVLFVSHDLASVQALCDRIIWIQRGTVRMDGDPLDVIKQYSAFVRKEEDIRLHARDLKVAKKRAVLLDKNDEIYDTFIFHLAMADGTAPSKPQRIYALRLLAGDQELASIDVGSPMDNSMDHQNCIIEGPGFMDWGPSKKDESGTYREYLDLGGKYRHAAFQFALPKALSQGNNISSMRLEIDAAITDDKVTVGVWNGECYTSIGMCAPGARHNFGLSKSHWQVKNKGAADDGDMFEEPAQANSASSAPENLLDRKPSEYGAGGAKISKVILRNANGEESRSFEVGQAFTVELHYETFQELLDPAFVFCAYMPDGRCATQWIVTSSQLNRPQVNGKGKVIFRVDKLLMGRGAYVASAAIFKYLRSDGLESESYHVIDRSIHFQIHQSLKDAHDLGLFIQPFQAELS